MQWAKNNRHHSGIKCTPYSALFSHEPQLGLRSTTIPAELIDRIDTEEDLQRAISEAETGDNIQPGTTAPITEPEPSHQPPATPQHGMFDLGVDIPISEVDSEISQAMSSSDAEMGVNIQTGKTASGIEPEPFHEPPATPQHGSFDLGVHIPISDVGSEMEINLEDDEVEVENDEFDNDVDGDGGACHDSSIFNILAKSGIYSEYVCRFCDTQFVGKNMCVRCRTYCHTKPSCSVLENGDWYCLVYRYVHMV